MAAKKTADKKTRCGGTMTESAYLAWIRSALRSKSLRWPPRAAALVAARRPYKGPNKLQKWEYKCAMCGDWYKMKETQVDHYPKDAGSILSVADIGEFCNNLYCEVDNLRVLCVDCHSAHTLMQKAGISLDEAKARKAADKWIKAHTKQELLDKLQQSAYNVKLLTNADKRRDALIEVFTKEVKNG